MDVQTWKAQWETFEAYQKTEYKNLPAFWIEREDMRQTICFPEPFLKTIQRSCPELFVSNTFYCFQEAVERFTFDFRLNDEEFRCILIVRHDEHDRKIQFITRENAGTQQCFFLQLYEKIMDFVERYSPYRLFLITNEYELQLPSWMIYGPKMGV